LAKDNIQHLNKQGLAKQQQQESLFVSNYYLLTILGDMTDSLSIRPIT